jgi:hypothetical protein
MQFQLPVGVSAGVTDLLWLYQEGRGSHPQFSIRHACLTHIRALHLQLAYIYSHYVAHLLNGYLARHADNNDDINEVWALIKNAIIRKQLTQH